MVQLGNEERDVSKSIDGQSVLLSECW